MRDQANELWPNGISLVISVSMQFEAGGQPPKGTGSPFPKVELPESVPSDAATNTRFAYGYRALPHNLDQQHPRIVQGHNQRHD